MKASLLSSNIIYQNSPNPFTLHVRLTKACNADCSYCSSWQENPQEQMTVDEYRKSISFIINKWKELGIRVDFLTIEYVGGEILLVPRKRLKEIVEAGRELFGQAGITVYDGAQSNLIASSSRVEFLFELFEGRVGTSIDQVTDQRAFSGSASKYRIFMMKSEDNIVSKGHPRVPAVFTMDGKSIIHTQKQIELSVQAKRNLTIRPVFQGGCSISGVTKDQVTKAMVDALNGWFLSQNIILEPIHSLLKKRMQNKFGYLGDHNLKFCSFQSDCAVKSMSLEPNGDLYICQEMADAGLGLLGNAVSHHWNQEIWDEMDARPYKLSMSCMQCDYFVECQGGCMLQAMQDGQGIYGKSELCQTWKKLFYRIDQLIELHGHKKTANWLDYLEENQYNKNTNN